MSSLMGFSLAVLCSGMLFFAVAGCNTDTPPAEEVYRDTDTPPAEEVYEEE